MKRFSSSTVFYSLFLLVATSTACAQTLVELSLSPSEHSILQGSSQIAVCIGDQFGTQDCRTFLSSQLGNAYNYRRVSDSNADIEYSFRFSDPLTVPDDLPTYFVGIQLRPSQAFRWKELRSQTGALRSLPGPEGPEGAQGARGPLGPTGQVGPTGPAGPGGVQGPNGPVGDPGDPNYGPQGDPGPIGNVGPTGPMGPMGPRGPEGALGPVGNPGPRGSVGPTRQYTGFFGVCTKIESASCGSFPEDTSYSPQSSSQCWVPEDPSRSSQNDPTLCNCYYTGGCDCKRCIIP